jgi:hypothetical protein
MAIFNNIEFDTQNQLDVEKFIRYTTYDIWNKKLVGKIYDCYTNDTIIHAGMGKKVIGADNIIADTMAWLTAFPDMEVKILDIIWSGNEVDGYRVSMPWSFIGTNTGFSEFGPPTGKRIDESNNLGIANTFIKKVNGSWMYIEEWSTYDINAKKMVCTPD